MTSSLSRTTYRTGSSLSPSAAIASIKSSYLTFYPHSATRVLQIPASKPFLIPATTGPPFAKLEIPPTHQLLLWPHPGPAPSSAPPAHTLRSYADPTTPFPHAESVSYYAVLELTSHSKTRLVELENDRRVMAQQREKARINRLFALAEESDESVTTRTQFGNIVPTTVLPSYFLRAFAALGNLLGPAYLTQARAFTSLFDRRREDALLDDSEGVTTFADGCDRFFDHRLLEVSQLYTANPLFARNDPVRLAFYSISEALSDAQNDDTEEGVGSPGFPDPAAVNNEFAFRELFKAYATNNAVVWDLADTASHSFAWQIELEKIQKFLVSATKFQNSNIVLPVNVKEGFNTVLNFGIAPESLSHLYTIDNTSRFLSRKPDVIDTLFAAANHGADWDRMNMPMALSRVQNTASYKMGTSGGSVYEGMYIESKNAIADILMFGKVADVKLVDLSSADIFDSSALRDLGDAVNDARSATKADAKTFKANFGAIIGDIRRAICMHISLHGLVFETMDGYKWIGVDHMGCMTMKKAVPFDGDLQSIKLPIPGHFRKPSEFDQPPEPPVEETRLVLEAPQEVSEWRMKQDSAFLIQDGEGTKPGSTSEIGSVSEEGDVGLLVLLSAVRFCRTELDAGFTRALITQRAAVRWVTEDGGAMDGNRKLVKVDAPMKYANLLVLEDNVVVDHEGQGWICGVDYLRGRDGGPGKLMAAEADGCAPSPIVEADFSVPDTLLIAP